MNKHVLKPKGSSAAAFMPMSYSIDCTLKPPLNGLSKSEGIKDEVISEEELLQFLWKS